MLKCNMWFYHLIGLKKFTDLFYLYTYLTIAQVLTSLLLNYYSKYNNNNNNNESRNIGKLVKLFYFSCLQSLMSEGQLLVYYNSEM